MRTVALAGIAACLCLIAAPAWAGAQEEPKGEAATSEAPVGVVGEVKPPTELQEIAGVRGWVINGVEIAVAELEKLAASYHGPYILQDKVAEILLAQEAARQNITVTAEDVEGTVKHLRDEMGLRSEVAFESFLRGQRVTRQWFHDKARAYALMQKVLADQIYVSDREIEAYYRRNQQLYRQAETVEYRAMGFTNKASAEAALAEIRKGRSFQEVAKATAASAADRAVSGELQYYMRGQPTLPPEFATALFAAPLNQVTGPVEVMGQFYLIRIEKKIDPHQFTLDEVKGAVREQLSRQKLEQVVWPNWIQQQLKGASIQVLKAE